MLPENIVLMYPMVFLNSKYKFSRKCQNKSACVRRFLRCTVKPALSGHSIRRQKLVFKTHNRLMQVKSIAECSKGSILQYFRTSLSYHLSLRPLFCLFLCDRLRQVLLYVLCVCLAYCLACSLQHFGNQP